jgi:glutamate-ammonia-ligase adenylyltransferase
MSASRRQAAIDTARENATYLAESLTLFSDIEAAFPHKTTEQFLTESYVQVPNNIGEHEAEMAALRILKRRVHLIIALSDISQMWTWVEVTRALTELSDFCMRRLFIAGAQALDIFSGDPDNPVPGLFCLAMGKYGAGELNYSSDIDFCIFYDPDVISLPRPERAERTLVKFVQKLIAGFERMTGEGYIFRTDLRLRPDPRSNAVAVSTLTAERYYETLGQNWERAAMIKARICGGDRLVGQDFIDSVLRPFIWRRSLDFAAIEDIHSIKRQIQARQGEGKLNPAGHNLKLGTGGIREIEFYAQTQQLILGGRHKDLRTPRTVDALKSLMEGGFVDPQDAAELSDNYALLRKFEHAAQMREDAQTHIAPEEADARLQLAKLAGYNTLKDFDDALLSTLQDVSTRYQALFPNHESLGLEEGTLSFTGVEPYPATLDTLTSLGFAAPERLWTDMASWLGGRISATRTERTRELLTRLAPRLIKICSETQSPDRAFAVFGQFFTRVNGGVSLLSMFLQKPESLAQLIDLMLISPRLSDTISARPSILDAMISPEFHAVEIQSLGADYLQVFNVEPDFEGAMNYIRRCQREDQFTITAATLRGQMDASDCAEALSQLADEVINVMLPVSVREIERRLGPLSGDYAVIALGKAGGQELSLSSDLDVMVLYDADASQIGAFTKLTQTLVSAVSSVTAEGRLYELDMALRPSGRSGPVAVSLEAFTRYYSESAWSWEFMALTRARVMAVSSDKFEHRLTDLIPNVLNSPRPDLDIQSDVADMLLRLREQKPPRGEWDVKNLAGGMRDIEFIAQSLYLSARENFAGQALTSTQDMLTRAKALSRLSVLDYEKLSSARAYFSDLTQYLALTHGGLAGDVEPWVLSAIAKLMKIDTVDQLRERTVEQLNIVERLLPKFIDLARASRAHDG